MFLVFRAILLLDPQFQPLPRPVDLRQATRRVQSKVDLRGPIVDLRQHQVVAQDPAVILLSVGNRNSVLQCIQVNYKTLGTLEAHPFGNSCHSLTCLPLLFLRVSTLAKSTTLSRPSGFVTEQQLVRPEWAQANRF